MGAGAFLGDTFYECRQRGGTTREREEVMKGQFERQATSRVFGGETLEKLSGFQMQILNAPPESLQLFGELAGSCWLHFLLLRVDTHPTGSEAGVILLESADCRINFR